MQSLEKRHEARAQRKADNMAERGGMSDNGGLGGAMAAIANANEAMRGLTKEQREDLQARMAESPEDFGVYPDEDRADMAGIGVVNPLILGSAERKALENSSVQKGEMPEASFDPAKGNINGQAVEAATNGWGADEAESDGKKAPAKKAEEKDSK